MNTESQKVGVRISKATGGAYADMREVIEDELQRIGQEHVTIPIAVERFRLEREALDAVRYWRRAQGEAQHVTEVDGMQLVVVRAWFKLRKAADALVDFESKQETK